MTAAQLDMQSSGNAPEVALVFRSPVTLDSFVRIMLPLPHDQLWLTAGDEADQHVAAAAASRQMCAELNALQERPTFVATLALDYSCQVICHRVIV